MATKITDLRQYWQASPDRQIRTLEVIRADDLEAVARERKLVVYRDKLVSPKDYPCACGPCDPVKCWQEQPLEKKIRDRLTDKPKLCPCPCHTYYDGRAI